jgi:hypothetical protein
MVRIYREHGSSECRPLLRRCRCYGTGNPDRVLIPGKSDEGAMNIRASAACVCAAVIAVTTLAVSAAEAAPKRKQYVDPANRPRARIVVAPRSFLDAGTEVVPGERKFTDYAYPPTYTPLGSIPNTGGKVGWDRSPFMQPFQVPGTSW